MEQNANTLIHEDKKKIGNLYLEQMQILTTQTPTKVKEVVTTKKIRLFNSVFDYLGIEECVM
tara:strand:+ start:107 stop:292 length:186 start_codon:yes stop_codon:yes gene_type:complete